MRESNFARKREDHCGVATQIGVPPAASRPCANPLALCLLPTPSRERRGGGGRRTHPHPRGHTRVIVVYITPCCGRRYWAVPGTPTPVCLFIPAQLRVRAACHRRRAYLDLGYQGYSQLSSRQRHSCLFVPVLSLDRLAHRAPTPPGMTMRGNCSPWPCHYPRTSQLQARSSPIQFYCTISINRPRTVHTF